MRPVGSSVTPPARAGRARPDGVRLDWETANVGQEPNGTFFPFLIRDFTPREQRAYPSGKPATQDFSGVARVVIAVRDLAASAKRYRAAYGLPRAGSTGRCDVRRAPGVVCRDAGGARDAVEPGIMAGGAARQDRRRAVRVHSASAKRKILPGNIEDDLVRNRGFLAGYRENRLVARVRVICDY